jgi:hypothetical protein
MTKNFLLAHPIISSYLNVPRPFLVAKTTAGNVLLHEIRTGQHTKHPVSSIALARNGHRVEYVRNDGTLGLRLADREAMLKHKTPEEWEAGVKLLADQLEDMLAEVPA